MSEVQQFGKYNVGVKVSVKDGQISDVVIEGSDFKGDSADENQVYFNKAAKGMKEKLVGLYRNDAEKLNGLDAVSGATASSNAIKEAAMNALGVTIEKEVIPDAPTEALKPGFYSIELKDRTDVVDHGLVGEEKKALGYIRVDASGKMYLTYQMVSGSDKEPLYVLGYNGWYKGNNISAENLTMDGVTYETESAEVPTIGQQNVVTNITVPLDGLRQTYVNNVYLYVEAMKKLDGVVSGVNFDKGKFNIDSTVMFFYYKNKRSTPSYNTTAARSTSTIFVKLLTIAVPITIGAAVMSLTNVIDTFMIGNRLQAISVTPDLFRTLTEFFGVNPQDAMVGANISHEAADVMYGSYSGYAMSLFNLPPSIVTSISMSIVPAISAALAISNKSQARLLTESSIRITTIFSLPCAIGLAVLSTPILICLYNNARAQDTLTLLSLAIVFVCTVSVSTAILQAAGHVFIPVRNMLIGGLFKVVSNYVLIAVPALNIGGAPVSTFCCYLLIAGLNLMSIKKIIKPNFNVRDFIIKPFISALIMGLIVYLSFNVAAGLLGCPLIDLSVQFVPQNAPV